MWKYITADDDSVIDDDSDGYPMVRDFFVKGGRAQSENFPLNWADINVSQQTAQPGFQWKSDAMCQISVAV